MNESKGGVYLPEPEGYKRAQITFKQGIAISIDCQLPELFAKVEAFLASDEKFLQVTDAEYGEFAYLSREAVETAIVIGTTWVKNLRPRQDNNGKVILPAKFA